MISINRANQSVTILGDDLLTCFQGLADIFEKKDSLMDFSIDNEAGDSFTLTIRVAPVVTGADGFRMCGIVTQLKILKAIQSKGPFAHWLFVLPKYTFETFAKEYSKKVLGE